VIQSEPWQTDTCIGDWHYNRRLFDQHRYKSVGQVVRMLVNIVSKNGNLLLSIPVRGDGTIDEDEVAFLEGMSGWINVNSEGIFGSRPWKIYGEAPAKGASGMFNANRMQFGAEDIRFTIKGGALYAFLLGWPGEKATVIKSLATTSPHLAGQKISSVSLLGFDGKLDWSQDEEGLKVKMPAQPPSENVVTLKITGVPVK
jgi:alpha-L-fucosidase